MSLSSLPLDSNTAFRCDFNQYHLAISTTTGNNKIHGINQKSRNAISTIASSTQAIPTHTEQSFPNHPFFPK